MKELPPTIRKLVNFHTRNTFCWGVWKDEARIENIDLGEPSNRFMISGKPNYGAAFDISAHNAAEWDERIHADITKRIKQALADPRSSSNEERQLPSRGSATSGRQ